uniref:Ig-like domain-containing protein n=1 Tax=Heligmosomoides polygyrus TaxID=6339 RepID=A0A8L8KVA3_HELPZ
LMQAKTASVRVPLGGLARLVCTAESWPRPDVTWDKEGQQIFDSDNYATSVSGQYHSVHVLEIRRVEKHHYGSYRCAARNDNGIHFRSIENNNNLPSNLIDRINVSTQHCSSSFHFSYSIHYSSSLSV